MIVETLTDQELRAQAFRWATECGDVFGDPRVEIPALIDEILELRSQLRGHDEYNPAAGN